MDERFKIDFVFKGEQYHAMVTAGDRPESVTYVIEYFRESTNGTIQTIEICASDDDTGSDAIKWQQQVEDVGEIAIVPGMIQAIGEAIESYQM